MVVGHELSDCEMPNCGLVAERVIKILYVYAIILMKDEACFHLTRSVNKQNFHNLAEEHSQHLHQWPLGYVCICEHAGVCACTRERERDCLVWSCKLWSHWLIFP
jgi:hypothetical protein